MKYFISAITGLLLLSCSKHKKTEMPFDSFEYSFTALRMDYMVKFTNNDSVFLWKRFPKPENVSYAIMSDNQRNEVIALIEKIDFQKYKVDYAEENVTDATGFRFELNKNNRTASINIFGDTAPKELYEYATIFNENLKSLNFQPYKGTVDFGKPIRPDLP